MAGISGADFPPQLRNEYLHFFLSSDGALTRIDNLPAAESYVIRSDEVSLTTDGGHFRTKGMVPARRESGPDYARFAFAFTNQFDLVLDYSLRPGRRYLERKITLTNLRAPTALLHIELGRTQFTEPPREHVPYSTFWYAPTVSFLRWSKGGLFAGIENPFFTCTATNHEVVFSFSPGLRLKPGETYEGEPQFIGVYTRSGDMLSDEWPRTVSSSKEDHGSRPRFRNPSGHIPLDWNEIRAMREFAADYLSPLPKRFHSILYTYWYPLESLPNSPQAEAKYTRMLDQFQALDGDLLLLNALAPMQRPGIDTNSFWDVAPAGSAAERILAHARAKGLQYGFYMGVAAPKSDGGNASGLPFAPERPEWKKVDPLGGSSGENCLACDEFSDWWFAVQRNTIRKFGLNLWSWDPGPGNGFFCYSDKHGHVPGQGGYKGWRNATTLLRRLKDEFPDLFLMSFYGRKEYGLWGFKYFDQHEAYWEQTIFFGATVYPDLHDDRVNADGVRLQSWWNQNFRFMPAVMNHALTHRIGENSYDSRLPKVWDQLGWKYSLMSGLASAGSVTACILPEEVSQVPGMAEFYRKWVGWARQHFDYVKYDVAFGDQVRIGGIDGHARINGDHGFIFLCNPGPRPARTQFKLDAQIGLHVQGTFTLREIYPRGGVYYFDSVHQCGIFSAGQSLSCVVPAYEIMLLELNRFTEAQLPLVYGVNGTAKREGDELGVEGATGQPGETTHIAVLPPPGRSFSLRVNGVKLPLQSRAGYDYASVRFTGPQLPRLLDIWRAPDGQPFKFPFHPAADQLTVRSAFPAGQELRALLKAAAPQNLEEIAPLVERWRQDHGLPHNFAWAWPDRLWLVMPFTDADRVREVRLECNGKPVPVATFTVSGVPVIHYADLTDHVQWGGTNELALHLRGLQSNQFLGPFLDYPTASLVTTIEPCSAVDEAPVVFDRQMDPEIPARWGGGPGSPAKAPTVVSAQMDPPFAGAAGELVYQATVDISPGQLRGVYLSAGWVGSDVPMRFNAASNAWIYSARSPRRFPILDPDRSYIWAVATNGGVSEPKPVPMRWLFKAASTAEARAALASLPDPTTTPDRRPKP